MIPSLHSLHAPVITTWWRWWGEGEEVEKKIKRTDGDIDELVYELYRLTEEEIAVVERHS